MIGRQVIVKGQLLGSELKRERLHYFFGTALCTRELMSEIFPQYQFRLLNQVHGDVLTESQADPATADAHWTRQENIALVVKTADCLPVLFGSEGLVVAAHAGWRGIENRLLLKCARFIKEQGVRFDCALIGPHIQAPHFEVGRDVADQLLKRHREVVPDGPVPELHHPDPAKSFINLGQIAAEQIRSAIAPLAPVEVSRESTFSSQLFHSFRRGKAQDARQYSFVALTE